MIQIAHPRQWDLTPANLEANGLDPIIPGDYVNHRYQAKRLGAAISLLGAVLVLSVRKRENSIDAADLVLQRRSLDTIASWSPTTTQLAVDADQDAFDDVAETGKGCWGYTFTPADQAALLAAVGHWYYDVKAQFTDAKVRTLLRGRILIPYPQTIGSQFTP